MDLSVLEDVGLSAGEAKTYTTLLELGTTKIGPVIKKAGLASSATHNAVNTLVNKGLVAYVKKGQVKHYTAAPPKELSRFVEEKRNNFRSLLPELEMRAAHANMQEEAEVFEGWKGVRTMQALHLDPAKKGDKFFFFAADVPPKNKEIQAFFEKYDAVRKEKGVIAKGIAPKRMKHLFKHRSYLKMKYVDHPVPPGLGMCANGITLISFEDRPVGYLLRSKQLYDIFRNYFDSIWKNT